MIPSSSSQLLLNAQCGLFDIEGTVADIRFVYDVMFPYVRRELPSFLAEHWEDANVTSALQLLASDIGESSSAVAWGSGTLEREASIDRAVRAVHQLMDGDSKTTGLKALQGLIWESGFRSGALRSELFSDVLPALERWKARGIELRIYSSGSVLAQKLFFGHTQQGDLTHLFCGYYDTTIGNKREAPSYMRIANDCGVPIAGIVFFSDVAAELQAAASAGMQVVGCERPNHVPLDASYQGPAIRTFDEIDLVTSE